MLINSLLSGQASGGSHFNRGATFLAKQLQWLALNTFKKKSVNKVF